MSYIDYEKNGKIAYIMINRSEMNPVNYEMVDDLHSIWKDFQADDGLWVAILGSKKKNFSVGFDINEIKKILDEGKYSWAMSSMFGKKRLGPDEHSVTKPIIGIFDGHVNGVGFWLFLQSDIRIATQDTSFGLAEGRLNFPIEFSGLLSRYLPRAIINELIFTAKTIRSQRFFELGIINKIVDQENLMREAVSMAEVICESGPEAIRVMKQLVDVGYDMDYRGLMMLSANMIVDIVNTENTKEAVRSFFAGVKPVWKVEK